MFKHEAVVYPIVGSSKGLDEITEFVQDNGGKVVEGVADLPSAYGVMQDDHFELRTGNANVAIVSDSLGAENRFNHWHDTSGQFAVREGLLKGKLGRADVATGIGLVSVGYSPDKLTGTERAAGANLFQLHAPDAAARWAAILAPHPEKPTYMPDKAIERRVWSDNDTFEEIVNRVLQHRPWEKIPSSVLVHSLSIREKILVGDEEYVEYEEDVVSPTKLNVGRLIARATLWQEAANDYYDLTVNERTVDAVVEAGDHLYVVNASTKLDKGVFDSRTDRFGRTDRIAIAKLGDLPADYWKNQNLEQPSI